MGFIDNTLQQHHMLQHILQNSLQRAEIYAETLGWMDDTKQDDILLREMLDDLVKKHPKRKMYISL